MDWLAQPDDDASIKTESSAAKTFSCQTSPTIRAQPFQRQPLRAPIASREGVFGIFAPVVTFPWAARPDLYLP